MALSRTVPIAILILSCIFPADCVDTTVVNKICNGNKYSDWSLYSFSVARVFSDLADKTAKSGCDYYSKFDNSGHVCYGHAACNGTLSQSDCSYCVRTAWDDVDDQCDHSIGVQFQLHDCRLRYENYPFTE
ncbi:antifungal protein ginkbilobin-like protein [Eucalyptus grandis]|uniref:antifungal protein ginkbilobin-like protein n=1 Tax=Eucalyptus grandis TaxID=71139 RepID=UPI000525DE0E|nr:antifungal protein ginkbilobin-like protein [Eucalyptus grandis]